MVATVAWYSNKNTRTHHLTMLMIRQCLLVLLLVVPFLVEGFLPSVHRGLSYTQRKASGNKFAKQQDDNWRDGSNSGKRLSSERLRKLEEMQAAAPPSDKSSIAIIGNLF